MKQTSQNLPEVPPDLKKTLAQFHLLEIPQSLEAAKCLTIRNSDLNLAEEI